MVSLSSPEKIREYLVNNKLIDVFIFLVASADNLRCRGNLLSENLADLTQGLQRIIQKIGENPDVSSSDIEVSQLFKDLHYLELETIQRTSIFIELLAVYYHIMRKNLRDLPRAIGAQDIDFSLNSEFDYFRNQSVQDIQKNFKYPDVNNFSELTSDEKKELREILEESAKMMLEFFKEIYRFNHRFRPIYNKYKHVMSEFTGVYGIDKEKHDIQSHVYVRQKRIDKENNPHYSVSIIPLSTDTIQYFDKIARCVWTLLMFLLDNQLLSFANEGKDFIPRNLLVPEGKRQRFEQITEKITSYCVPNLQTMLKVNPSPDAGLQSKINEALKTDHIYVMNKDILDVEFLKDSQITRSDNSETAENAQKGTRCEDFEIVDIASASEDWSTYRLTDGTLLKVRDILIKAVRLSILDEQGNPIYNLNTQTISGTVPTKSILGKESAPFTQEELSKSVIDPNMKFDVIQEPWNKYVLADGTEIEIKTVLSTASKTNKYGHYGEPIYLTTRMLNFKTNIPSRLHKT
jgi:hypothetical protein